MFAPIKSVIDTNHVSGMSLKMHDMYAQYVRGLIGIMIWVCVNDVAVIVRLNG